MGCTVDEPLTTIEPVTAPPADGLPPALLAGALPAGAALLAAAALDAGAVVAPPPPVHAPATSAAANASVPMRFDALIPTLVLLFGRGLGEACPSDSAGTCPAR